MEEAEVLCDRIGIIANGSLQCIGSSKEVHLHMPLAMFSDRTVLISNPDMIVVFPIFS
jgi:ABC-type multidrug transport system ATPase subunit